MATGQPAQPGLWFGTYQGLGRQWLRCYDTSGAWILTPHEQAQQRAEQADRRAEQERQRAERLAAQLRVLGINPEQ